jgi:ribosomal protein L29
MKKKEKQEIRTKTREELLRLLQDLRRETEKIAFDMSTGKVKDTNLLRKKGKSIAFVLTVLSEKEALLEALSKENNSKEGKEVENE